MARRWSTLAGIALLVSLLTPVVGSANHGESCGGRWSAAGVRDCPIGFKGFPLTVYGDSEAADAHVRVWITVSTYPQPLLACESTGTGFTSCDGELGAGEGLDVLIGTLPLTCNVSGAKGGKYGCASGCVTATQGIECQILHTYVPAPSPLPTPSP